MKTTHSNSFLVELSHNYAQATYWANETIVEWLKTKPAELLEKEVASSFPGIRETLVHIWDTDRFWLAVITKQPLPVSFRMQPFQGTLSEAIDGLLTTSAMFKSAVLAMGEQELAEAITLETPWFAATQPRFQYIQHCMNHSSYHRGQIVTMGHHLGFHDAPMTDYSYYLVMAAERKAA